MQCNTKDCNAMQPTVMQCYAIQRHGRAQRCTTWQHDPRLIPKGFPTADRPQETTGDTGRQRQTTGDNGTQRETMRDNGRQRETTGDHRRPWETTG